MPPNVRLTAGNLRVADRTANIHPEHWEKKVDRYNPLDEFPATKILDRLKQGEETTSKKLHYFEKPFNALTGVISDVYNDIGLSSAFAGSGVVGTTVVIKPHTDSVNRLLNIKANMQVEIHSSSVNKSVKLYVTAVEPSGSFASFTAMLLEADTSNVLAGTGLTWIVGLGSEEEEFELGEGVNEHETEHWNYVYTDSEAFSITRDELNEFSRILEDKKKERELDALVRLTQRRENGFLEGVRDKRGTRYYAGGFRWALKEEDGSKTASQERQLVDWTEDTAFSASTDSIEQGTIPFIRRVLAYTRQYARPGAKPLALVSDYTRDLITELVLASGNYNISYGENKWGIDVTRIHGLEEELELAIEPLFNHYPARKRSMYIARFDYIKRHQVKMEDTSLGKRSKGLEYVPWSAFKKMDGENFISRIKGGFIASESYSVRRRCCHAIIDNLGLSK